MKIVFWGTKGSLPSSCQSEDIQKKVFLAVKESLKHNLSSDSDIKDFINELPFEIRGGYGVNTSCIEIEGGDEYILCDAGTGIRDFGNHIMRSINKGQKKHPNIFNIFMSHLHWDHLQGFPFFTPAYIAGNTINIFGFHKELRHAFVTQQAHPFFPVPLKYMNANINFIQLEPEKEYRIAGVQIKGLKQDHPGDSYGYRFEKDGKIAVYSSDSEHKEESEKEDYIFLSFFKDADVLIFDAQYSLLDAISVKENWGHSNNIIAVELSVKAGVKRLCIFHNEPTCDDETLSKFLDDTRKYLRLYDDTSPLEIDLAYDGMVIEL